MKVDELIEIAVANADELRVEVTALEPAEIATEAVSGLAQLVAELVDNALSFSEPDDVVRVDGSFERNDYVLSISDTGVGMSEHFLNALNRALEDPTVHIGGPEPRLGIQLVARLAGRLGIEVRLIPGMPGGTTARAKVPSRLVSTVDPGERRQQERPVFAEAAAGVKEMALTGVPQTISTGVGRTIDLTKYESRPPLEVGEPAQETTPTDVEEFLESVFAPLVGGSVAVERPPGRGDEQPSPSRSPDSRPTGRPSETTLQVRVPGENFSLAEDEPSTAAGEGAVDIRKALSSYDGGRQSASRGPVSTDRP